MRVLAITTDASLEVALSSLPGDWEILSARDPDGALQAACRSDIALLALGTTERGVQAVEALHRLGVGLPCLVIGDVAGSDTDLAPVLVRPFAMAELIDAMRGAPTYRPAYEIPQDVFAEVPAPPIELPQEPQPDPKPQPEPEADAFDGLESMVQIVEPPAKARRPKRSRRAKRDDLDDAANQNGSSPVQPVEDPSTDETMTTVRLDDPGWDQLPRDLRPRDAEPVVSRDVAPPPATDPLPAAARSEPVARPEPVVEPQPERRHAAAQDRLGELLAKGAPKPAVGAPPQADLADWAMSLLHEIGQAESVVPETPTVIDAPEPRTLPAGLAPTEATAARIVRHAAAAPPPGDWLADSRAQERTGLHRLRRRRRGPAIPSGGARAAMLRRVRSALEGARDLADLIDEIPALTRPSSMAQALVRETVELLGAETAVLYAADANGPYRVIASHGLSPVEQAMTVPNDQALLLDVAHRMEAVLVAPVDYVRGLVTGVAGTSCEALMIAPLEVDNTCHGLLLAGRHSFTERDLERFWLLAEEAAPGFAASRLIERLSGIDLQVAL